MTKTFFIADTHFNHEDCIQFDHRPFRDAVHMWYHMRDSWNKVVGKNDAIYILGDMFWPREPDFVVHLLNHQNVIPLDIETFPRHMKKRKHRKNLENQQKRFCKHITFC